MNNNNNLFVRNLVLFDFKPPIFPPFKIQNININLKNYTRRYAEVASLIKRARCALRKIVIDVDILK